MKKKPITPKEKTERSRPSNSLATGRQVARNARTGSYSVSSGPKIVTKAASNDLTDHQIERAWDRSFAESHDILEHLGNKALAEHRAGRTKPIDPDQM